MRFSITRCIVSPCVVPSACDCSPASGLSGSASFSLNRRRCRAPSTEHMAIRCGSRRVLASALITAVSRITRTRPAPASAPAAARRPSPRRWPRSPNYPRPAPVSTASARRPDRMSRIPARQPIVIRSPTDLPPRPPRSAQVVFLVRRCLTSVIDGAAVCNSFARLVVGALAPIRRALHQTVAPRAGRGQP